MASFWSVNFWGVGFWAPNFWAGQFPLSGIENDDAQLNVTRYEIDDRTGARAYPGTFTRDYLGYMTNRKSADVRSAQEAVRGKRDDHKGSVRPELNDEFITDAIRAEDL